MSSIDAATQCLQVVSSTNRGSVNITLQILKCSSAIKICRRSGNFLPLKYFHWCAEQRKLNAQKSKYIHVLHCRTVEWQNNFTWKFKTCTVKISRSMVQWTVPYTCTLYVWQSRVEIKHYSVGYCESSTTVTQYFRYGRGSYTRCVNSWILDTFTQHVWAPPLTEVLHTVFERGNALEIRNGIMFDFYPGLPHVTISQMYTACHHTETQCT